MSDLDEHRQDLEAQAETAANKASIWKSFMEHPGWAQFAEILGHQVALNQTTVCMSPVQTVGQCFSQEFFKGEAAGLAKALSTPQTEFENADRERRELYTILEAYDAEKQADVRADVSRVDRDAFGE